MGQLCDCDTEFLGVIAEYVITKRETEILRNRKAMFQAHTKTRKQVILTLITTYGVAQNEYRNAADIELTMDCLFLEQEFSK